ncbi:hypothetical protein [Polaromonas sp. CG9_12]|nr:hypothetical protein [Polaromonas sp. CG9_12]
MSSDLLDAAALRQACTGRAATPCTCALGACPGWESFTEDRWPGPSVQRLGTLRDPAVDEPTLQEFHPGGTRYGSPDAPLALEFFPCNRCDAYACNRCGRTLLRYTEYGGYYVDHRVREVDPKQVV